ncbi:MAG: hypothetical protein ACOYKE_02955 [Ferruginibacter sp.]
MSFENFPTTETPTTPPPPPPAGKDWKSLMLIGLVIALLGTWGYIIWDKSNNKEIIQQKDTLYASALTEKDTLQSLLDEATMRYDLLKTTNAKKDSTITMRDREIAEKKSKIQKLLSKQNATQEELAEAKRLIASLNSDIEVYQQQIEILKGEKIVLTQEKEAVTQDRNRIQQNLDSANSAIKEKENTIDVGSTLNASGFNIVGVDERKNGKEKSTTKAKKVDKLRISFTLDENRIAQSGPKDIYVCITSPDGKPVAVEALGSGVFTTRDGEQKSFTQRVQVNYVQGQRQIVSFDWKQNADFATGNYKIEVYHNGFKIGEGVRYFKKGGLFG